VANRLPELVRETVDALNRLGATQTMEDFISFILGIASEDVVRPVYSVVPADSMDEQIAENLKATVIIQHDARDVEKLPAFPAFAK